ncbi:hypothetical protein MAR_010620 [Mya arenaria]|uniref:Uncharacterized protein n=1 Tax=Mya arenaria TaxID=6604 RepID=A0ABY7E5J9_MYAAR|nr:hypothetical protein MAR_010620 [Mya arenaria]
MITDKTPNLEQLVDISRPLKTQYPSWSDFMQARKTGRNPGKLTVLFHPMIDQNPSDLTYIYSTLDFIDTQAKRLSVAPIVTFDQPLAPEAEFWLARLDRNSLCPNTVTLMSSGKAVSRALRGHILVDSALNSPLVDRVFPLASKYENSVFCTSESKVHSDSSERNHELHVVKNFKTLLYGVYSKEMNPYLAMFLSYSAVKSSIGINRTTQLWLQYIDMVAILGAFNKAERTGNWLLQFMTMEEKLPFFAAAGHHLYLISGLVYLQQMASLQTTYKESSRCEEDLIDYGIDCQLTYSSSKHACELLKVLEG